MRTWERSQSASYASIHGWPSPRRADVRWIRPNDLFTNSHKVLHTCPMPSKRSLQIAPIVLGFLFFDPFKRMINAN